MSTYYKSIRENGTDFHTGTVQWAPPAAHEGEWIVRHPTATEIGDNASAYLSVSTVETDCTGMVWPCRLLTVEAVEDVTTPSEALPNKRAGVAFRVTGERPAHEALGPQGEHVAALIYRASRLTDDELRALDAAWYAAWYAARNTARNAAKIAAQDAAQDAARNATQDAVWGVTCGAARDAARDATWDAVRDVTWGAARIDAEDAATGLVVRDLISTEHYDALTRPWRTTVGPIHPDDED